MVVSAGDIAAFEATLASFRTGVVRPLLIADALGIAAAHGVGGGTWTRTRVTGGDPATDSTTSTTPGIAVGFLENNPLDDKTALPATALYSAPYWGIAALGVDIQVGDVFSNGSIAFLITGAPDVSQGYQRIPAALKS